MGQLDILLAAVGSEHDTLAVAEDPDVRVVSVGGAGADDHHKRGESDAGTDAGDTHSGPFADQVARGARWCPAPGFLMVHPRRTDHKPSRKRLPGLAWSDAG
ncbi:hypothetical protein GCM10023168_35830 [Fodinibacter luteus]|uniref:Uncharacterized protein n=1 Tax=Fodinibacter luteus TaxID=552064 RepID=A0ABP8KR18_9MICO